MNPCNNCLRPINDKYGIQCDECQGNIHIICVGLSVDDRITRHKIRSVKVFCNKCIVKTDELNELKLQSELIDLNNKIPDNCYLTELQETMNRENIINEVFDRQRRSNNVIVYNLPETANVHQEISNILIKANETETIAFKTERLEKSDIDELWIITSINRIKIAVGVVYVPYCSPSEIDQLEKSLGYTNSVADKTIILGDLNIDLLNKKNTTVYNKFMEVLNIYQLTQIITEPTRISKDKAALQDVICLTKDILTKESGVIDLFDMSDHHLIYCTLDLKVPNSKSTTITFRGYSGIDSNNFSLDASRINWNYINMLDNVDEMVAFFNNQLNSLLDSHAPYKKVLVKKRRAPFITYTILKMKDLK
ncbi:hypothetical protein FQR65_LT14399 [Abscondita terminalis]|nr:hypothetical protein FQR65_LT14399 [Abscondita terminalis]